MRGKLLPIFATTGDLAKLLSTAESKMAMAFYHAGLVEKNAPCKLGTSTEFLDAIMASGEMAPRLLVVPASEVVRVRQIPQKKGGMHYAIDQLENPNSIMVTPGGMINSTTLLGGQIDTISDAPESLALYATFAKVARKQFTNIKSNWVGPEAIRVLDSGGRLIGTRKAPPECDLKR